MHSDPIHLLSSLSLGEGLDGGGSGGGGVWNSLIIL